MDGLWDTPDLTAVIRVAARNVGRIDEVRRRLSPIREPFQRARAAFMRNTPQRSRKDIAAHYDLGNELFELMLDPTLMYSCGVFEHRDATLEEASLAKLEMVCEKLELGPRDHVVEIGTGWGGFAVYAATTRGCKVTTTTISREQHDVAARRVKEAGVEHLVDLRLDDYRDLRGSYDKLVSLEMIEAVGWQDFGTFFEQLQRPARPQRDDAAAGDHDGRPRVSGREGVEELHPHLRLPRRLPALARGDLEVRRQAHRHAHRPPRGPHARTTPRRCGAGARTSRPRPRELEALGYDERFRRLWRMYLSYCEAGFAERRIGLVQTVLAKPLAGIDALAEAPPVLAPRLPAEHPAADRVDQEGGAARGELRDREAPARADDRLVRLDGGEHLLRPLLRLDLVPAGGVHVAAVDLLGGVEHVGVDARRDDVQRARRRCRRARAAATR